MDCPSAPSHSPGGRGLLGLAGGEPGQHGRNRQPRSRALSCVLHRFSPFPPSVTAKRGQASRGSQASQVRQQPLGALPAAPRAHLGVPCSKAAPRAWRPLRAFRSVHKHQLEGLRTQCWVPVLVPARAVVWKGQNKGIFQQAVGYCRNTALALTMESGCCYKSLAACYRCLYLTVFIANNVPYVRRKKKKKPLRHLSLH